MNDTYRTTMEDVARAAGVSRTTVSFVLNNRDGVRIAPETRERVQQVAAELGYRPHGGARALASRRSSLIGLVSEIVTSPFGAATIRGIQDAIRRAGYTLFIVPTSTEADVDSEAFETLLKSRVEGIIYATGWNCLVRMPVQAHEIPTVLVHCIDPVSGLPCVRPDEEQLGRLAAQALLEGHHRDIGVIELDPKDGEAAPGRRVGCEAYLERAGIPWNTVSVAVGHGTTRGGYAAAARLLTDRPWLTGLVCGNDRMAMGAYDAIRERGLRVREDVAVIGIDDQELIADQVHPALTTVALPFEEMGKVAVSLLLALMEGEEVPVETLLPGKIVRRSSA